MSIVESSESIGELEAEESIVPQLKRVKAASASIRNLPDGESRALLLHLAELVVAHTDEILGANQKDLDQVSDTDPKKDRLKLTAARIQDLAKSLREVANLESPAGKVLTERTIEQGLQLKKIAVPLGVVGVIYESRPNVTLDVASLCLRSGNACVLKGGKEAFHSNRALVALIHEALVAFKVDPNAVMLLPTDRKYLLELLKAEKYVDIVIPRGSEALIQFVRQNSRIPAIETGAGVCHTYVEKTADLEKAARIVVNAKVSRPSVCNALDCIVVDREIAAGFLPKLKEGLEAYNVEVFADETAYPILKSADYQFLDHAQDRHFGEEFLDFKCAVKVVEDLDEALNHIQQFSSRHSEAIVSKDAAAISRFLNEVDAAAVYANASTRFTDGGVFGLGAEIGISTQKLHARGPFALEKLVTEKWVVNGDGQIR
ncbi:glutamate-5-semialdehyde dehydrogenase [Ravibacter arvi]|uniref:Gamma-glutamyl phosphate reductase n=1 Tax=Ravibacter arvi TaxID=2051041 RepID=A0ABP8MDE6_9BACT